MIGAEKKRYHVKMTVFSLKKEKYHTKMTLFELEREKLS
jgi:hypothetical protein